MLLHDDTYTGPVIIFAVQNIMKDRWMNIGCEDDELKPFIEARQHVDDKRIGKIFLLILLRKMSMECNANER